MYYERILCVLPESVRCDIIDICEGTIDGRRVLRVTLDRLLKDHEKDVMRSCKRIQNIENRCCYRYAKEIEKSYFYIKL